MSKELLLRAQINAVLLECGESSVPELSKSLSAPSEKVEAMLDVLQMLGVARKLPNGRVRTTKTPR